MSHIIKIFAISLLLSVSICGCGTAKKLSTTTIQGDQINANKTMIPEFVQTRGYQPSGKSESINNELISENYLVEVSIFDSTTAYNVKHIGYENYSVKVDTLIPKNIEPIALKEADQSFIFGLISFIALIGWILSTYYLLLFFAIAFNLVAIVFGIAGLRKGIIAKRIMRKNENIYSNTDKANWGIILSLPIFVTLLAIGIIVIYLIRSGNFWIY